MLRNGISTLGMLLLVLLMAELSYAQDSGWSYDGLELADDLHVKTAPTFNYEYESVCSKTADLAKAAQFKKPSGDWKADFLAVDKKRKLLHAMKDGKIFRSFNMALGKSPTGKKRKEGDNKTPEGLYSIDYKNSGSSFHLSLHISYPNQADIDWARKNGVSPGGDIFVHGLPNEKWKWPFLNHPKKNWTRGCVAVTNEEIEELWVYVNRNTPIELCP